MMFNLNIICLLLLMIEITSEILKLNHNIAAGKIN
jgi:hypothetical protein